MTITKKHSFLLVILMLVLAACSGKETASEPVEEVATSQPVPTVGESTEPPTVAADPTQTDTPALEPTPTEEEMAAETEAETAEPQPTATTAEETPTAESQFNGRYESTYFRGSESAPVTMIDYSDFL